MKKLNKNEFLVTEKSVKINEEIELEKGDRIEIVEAVSKKDIEKGLDDFLKKLKNISSNLQDDIEDLQDDYYGLVPGEHMGFHILQKIIDATNIPRLAHANNVKETFTKVRSSVSTSANKYMSSKKSDEDFIGLIKK